jgi:hypothetical protein
VIGILQTILTGIEAIGSFFLWAIETGINALFAVIEVAFNEAAAVTGLTLPETFAPPTIVGWLNWFFPVGAFVSIATGLVLSYGVFLSVRWAFKKAGVL